MTYRRSLRLLIVPVIAVFAFTHSAVGASAPAPRSTEMAQPAAPAIPTVPTITATGSATVSRPPDQAVVSLGVATVGKTSTEAQGKLNEALDKVVKAIKGLTPAPPDLNVQTQWLSLQPVYEQIDYREQQKPREPKIIGYNASNTVRVTVADVNQAGTIIDAAILAGANQVQGLSFELKNDTEARGEALQTAARDAKSKAESMAAALGLRVVRIIEVQDSQPARPYPMMRSAGRAMATAAAEMAPTVVEPGDVTIQQQVTVTVEVAEK